MAERLEVSERTIYRDIEALSAAGVPVYTERGPAGGCVLAEGYRTNLTGLTEDEVRTLFLSGTPALMADLKLGGSFNAALLKLLASLPAAHRRGAEQMRSRIHLDPVAWNRPHEEVPHLRAIYDALERDLKLRLTYRRGDGSAGERVVNPLGLVAKASTWYLVARAGEEMRVFRVSRVLEATPVAEPLERPPDFDLPAFWREWCAAFEASLPRYPARFRASPEAVELLPQIFGDWIRARIAEAAPPDAEGWLTLEVVFESLGAARTQMLGFGTWVEVLDPPELRASVAEFAREIATMYEETPRP
jgi:predicted DNA-binding transcriptional regulator YafY